MQARGPVSNWVPRKQRRHRPVSGKLTGGGAGEAFLRVRRGGLSTSCRRQRSGCGTLTRNRDQLRSTATQTATIATRSPRERPRVKSTVTRCRTEPPNQMKALGFWVCVWLNRAPGSGAICRMRCGSLRSSRHQGGVARVWHQTPPALHTPSSMPPRAATLPTYHCRLRIFQVCALPHDECAAKPALRLRLIASRSWRRPSPCWQRAFCGILLRAICDSAGWRWEPCDQGPWPGACQCNAIWH